MKKLLVATAAVLTLSLGTADAADMARPVYKAPPPPPPPVYSWTGCYIDAGVGYGMWNQDHTTTLFTAAGAVAVTSPVQETSGGRGWLGRLGGGCDYQFTGPFGGSLLIGVFGDYDFMNLKSHDFADFGIVGFGANEKESAAWYVGGRLGWVVTPQFVTFISGGWTGTRFDGAAVIGNTTNANPLAGTFIGFLPEHTFHGWFIGSGYEYQLGFLPGLTWKTEYRFAEYQSDTLALLNRPGFSLGGGITVDSRKFVQTVTSSLVWRFNWFGGGPMAGRY